MAYVNAKAPWEHIAQRDVAAVAVPTVADSPVVTDNLFLEFIHLVNPTAADAVVTIEDMQDTPLAVAVATVPAGSDWVRVYLGRRCAGGLKWSSTVAGVIGYIRGRW